MWIWTALAVTVLGCGTATSGSAPEMTAPDASADPDALAPAPLECGDLDDLIELERQVQANARATRGRYPLVLSHGFAGFDRVGPLEYFVDVAQSLRERGFAVYVTAVDPIASTEGSRGPQLARQVACIAERAGAGKLNLVGHSQGGLDARVVASDPQRSRYVASVTTIATPHRGTIIADAVLGLVPGATDALTAAIAELFGTIVGAPGDDPEVRAAMESLSVANSMEFNARHPDAPGVSYFSWAGRSALYVLGGDTEQEACAGSVLPNPDGIDLIDPLLRISFAWVESREGANDGLVAISSTRWGTFMGCVPADHLDQVGLMSVLDTNPISGFSHLEFFGQLAEQLEADGM